MHPCRTPPRSGFSLVELLVVIGIIGLLLALLLPSLAGARRAARDVACRAALRNVGQLALLHANAHHGYLPAAGWQWRPTGGVVNPEGMDDPGRGRYAYYDDAGIQRPLPISAALALAAGYPVRLDSRESLEDDLESPALRRLVECPAQPDPPPGVSQASSEGWQSPTEVSGYVFNEALLGRRDHPTPAMPVGHLDAVQRAAEVFFAMDGRPRNPQSDRLLLIFDIGPNYTLADFADQQLSGGGVGGDALDFDRHRYRANVLFLDWHVDNILLTHDDMSRVGVSKGIYNVTP